MPRRDGPVRGGGNERKARERVTDERERVTGVEVKAGRFWQGAAPRRLSNWQECNTGGRVDGLPRSYAQYQDLA